MQLKRTNLNDKITDTIDDFNDNWEVIEGEVNKKPDGLLIKNELVNGDFSDGRTRWGVSGGGGITVIGGVAKIVPAIPYTELNQLKEFTLLDKYYTCATVKNSSNTRIVVTIIGINGSGGEGFVIDETTESDKTFLSGVFTVNTIKSATRWSVKKLKTNDTSEFEVYGNNHLINLTQTFGAGNEPTKEEMDALIEIIGYIDGEYILSNLELVNWLLSLIRNNTLSITALGGTI